MNILIIDNYDSFTYNLSLLVKTITGKRPDVKRNDALSLKEVAAYDKIILSPGPGLPAAAGILLPLVERYAASKSILGVCLGHQAIGQVFGASLLCMDKVCHGIATPVHLLAEDVMFAGMKQTFMAGRYHSWIVGAAGLPEDILVTAADDQGYIMALRHKVYDVRGIQFHPESILTPQGAQMMANWLGYGSAI